MRIKKICHYVLRDYRAHVVDVDADRNQEANDKDRFNNYVAFVSLLHHAKQKKIYCGLTAYNTDILATFDLKKKTLQSLEYQRISEPFEVKIHRSLALASDGTVYGATSCLHRADKRLQAPGGSIFRVRPGSNTPEKLAVPVKHEYIQTITLDEQRQIIYGQTWPCLVFFVYHIDTGEVEDYGYVGSIAHISAIDDSGCLWSTWDIFDHNLFKYDPEQHKITFFHHTLPNCKDEVKIPGISPIDSMVNGGDGYLYIGTLGGILCRLDPKTAEVTYLGKPIPPRRIPGLVVWDDSLLLGVAGDKGETVIFAYDRKAKAFHAGPLIDSETGLKLYRPHDLVFVNNLAYVAETDVPGRSGYLWECEIEN